VIAVELGYSEKSWRAGIKLIIDQLEKARERKEYSDAAIDLLKAVKIAEEYPVSPAVREFVREAYELFRQKAMGRSTWVDPREYLERLMDYLKGEGPRYFVASPRDLIYPPTPVRPSEVKITPTIKKRIPIWVLALGAIAVIALIKR